jgi:DNA-binding response OmpR family regulator
MRILIIDDDEIIRELLCGTLKRVGHDVYELASAMGVARAIFEYDIDAVVVDLNLPDIDGDKLARALRQHVRGPSLGIVLISGLSLDELTPLALIAQADSVLSKANIRAGLEPAIMQACQRRERVARSS